MFGRTKHRNWFSGKRFLRQPNSRKYVFSGKHFTATKCTLSKTLSLPPQLVSLSLPNAPFSQPDCASTTLSTSTLALCVSLKSLTPSSPLAAYPTLTHQQKQRKNSNSPSETKSPNTHTPCRVLFRPRWERAKARVGVWKESGVERSWYFWGLI